MSSIQSSADVFSGDGGYADLAKVAIIGRPNVGKSTLINAFMGQKIAAVSPRPQTTRRKQLGILTLPDAQIVFMDTPGLHIPVHKLGEYMNEVAAATLDDADLLLWMVDASEPPQEEDRLIAARLKALRKPAPMLLVLNKVDLVRESDLPARRDAFLALLPTAQHMMISASLGRGRDELLNTILSFLPEGELFFDEEQVTDANERDIAAELIREAALLNLREEVPHGIAVRVDEFKERSEDMAYIGATLFVERESHKGIVIGQGGTMLKKIGSAARREIELMSGRKVFLELRVKVNKNWRSNPDALRLLGYFQEKE